MSFNKENKITYRELAPSLQANLDNMGAAIELINATFYIGGIAPELAGNKIWFDTVSKTIKVSIDGATFIAFGAVAL